jgi:hypothetical protein
MNANFTGRAKRIVNWLAQRTSPATLRDIHANEPGATRQQVSSTLAQLVDAGKIRRSGKRRHYLYTATRLVLVDKRSRAAKQTKAAQTYASHQARKPKPESQIRIPPKQLPSQQPRVLMPSRGPRLPGGLTADDIAADVAEFVRRGGHIQKLQNGDVSQPLRCAMRDVRTASCDEHLAKRSKQWANTDQPDDDIDDAA